MLYFFISVKSLDISNFNIPSITSMKCWFCNCLSLSIIDLNIFDISITESINIKQNLKYFDIKNEDSNYNAAKAQ